MSLPFSTHTAKDMRPRKGPISSSAALASEPVGDMPSVAKKLAAQESWTASRAHLSCVVRL